MTESVSLNINETSGLTVEPPFVTLEPQKRKKVVLKFCSKEAGIFNGRILLEKDSDADEGAISSKENQ